jgi:ABC-2 type transport system permease protein
MPIFDQGYQHWSGHLSGHAWRWLSIARRGVRVGMMNPFLRILVIVSWLPAAGLVFMLCLWGLVENRSPLVETFSPMLTALFGKEMLANPKQFRLVVWTLCFDRFLLFELYCSMIVVLLVGPGLISQDLRFNALPLYFSRPLRRLDYFGGKLGTIAWFLSMVLFIPVLLAYVFGMLFSLDITILWDTLPLLFGCFAYSAIIVLSAGTLMLAMSALSRNSRLIVLCWIALWSVGSIVSAVLDEVDVHQRRASFHRQQAEKQFQQHQEMMKQQAAVKQGGRPPVWVDPYEQERAEFELQAAKSNWRPLVSYTANLSRLGQQLLGTEAAWRKASELVPAQYRDDFLLRRLGPQYPWYWSAIVLAVLFGLSACILNYRIRSLDRLK